MIERTPKADESGRRAMSDYDGGRVLQDLQELTARLRGFGFDIDGMEDVAAQVNMLAINAAIEAAHAVSQSQSLKERILDEQMIIQSRMLRELLNQHSYETTTYWWQSLADRVRMDGICIADRTGRVVYSNETGLIGWVFPSDPKEQAYPFTLLMHENDAQYCQPIMRRSVDNSLFKYVGVSRQDEPGIVQVGFRADTVARLNMSVSVFGYIAQEMSRLSDVISKSAKSMGNNHHDLLEELKRVVEQARKASRGY